MEPWTCLRDVRVVDVAAGAVRAEQDVLLRGGCIAEVAATGAPESAEIIDGRGLFLAPGLIDGHVHLVLDCGPDPRRAFLAGDSSALWEVARRNAGTALQAGITTVRDCGAPAPFIFDFQREVERGAISGPRVLTCGHPLMRPRGHCHFFGGEVSSREQVRGAIERLARQGANFVKVIASGGGLTPGTRPGEADLPLELMCEAGEVAHGLGLPVAVHCHATAAIQRALDARLDVIEHASFTTPEGGYGFEEATALRLRDRGTVVSPTVMAAVRTARRIRRSGIRLNGADSEAVSRLDGRLTNVSHFHRLGIPLLGGTDCGVTDTPFDSLVDELLAYQQAGLSAAAALRTVTCEAARHLSLPDLGEVRPGYAADLVLLRGNPLEDLEVLRHPVMVMKDGRPVTGRRVIRPASKLEAQAT